jgi:hypothetical protein
MHTFLLKIAFLPSVMMTSIVYALEKFESLKQKWMVFPSQVIRMIIVCVGSL